MYSPAFQMLIVDARIEDLRAPPRPWSSRAAAARAVTRAQPGAWDCAAARVSGALYSPTHHAPTEAPVMTMPVVIETVLNGNAVGHPTVAQAGRTVTPAARHLSCAYEIRL